MNLIKYPDEDISSLSNEQKKGEPTSSTPLNNLSGRSKVNHIALIKRIIPYLFDTVASPGMISKDLDIPIELVRSCLGNLLRGTKLYIVFKAKCPVTGNLEYFITSNLHKSKDKPGEGLENE